MARRAESVVPVDATDIANRLAEFRKELGCEARIIIALVPDSATDLRVTVEAYTNHGTPIGVAREVDIHRPRPSLGLLGDLMKSLHRLFWKTEKLAHAPLRGRAQQHGRV